MILIIAFVVLVIVAIAMRVREHAQHDLVTQARERARARALVRQRLHDMYPCDVRDTVVRSEYTANESLDIDNS